MSRRALSLIAFIALGFLGGQIFSAAAQPPDRALSPSLQRASEYSVVITDQGLDPAQVWIEAGDTVTWSNQTTETLTLQSRLPQTTFLPLVMRDSSSGMLAAPGPAMFGMGVDWGGDLLPGSTYSHTFATVGVFPYLVASHPGWTGTVLVNPVITPPTPTPTKTPTVTPTPICGNPLAPDANLSVASMTVSPVWANGGQGSSRIIVTLNDYCSTRVKGWNSSKFQITSSRGTADDIVWEGDVNNMGQYAWMVDSLVVGTSTYTVTVDMSPTATPNWQTLPQHPSVAFVCIAGVGQAGLTAQSMKFAYSNPVELGTARRVISLTLHFTPRVGATGPFTVTNLTWGGFANEIWAGPREISSASPLYISPAGWNGAGTGGRSLLMGVSNKPLQFTLNYALSHSGVYTLTTTWDDGTGANICTSAPVVYSALP